MPPRKRSAGPTPVESLRHADTRANIPTGELRDFVADAERSPTRVRYERDPSLDPQLVWKGKDEQDSEDLVVPAVPIYIQEKIDPRAIVENLRRTAEHPQDEPELSLFDDFDGLDSFEQRVDFYHHGANWSNRMILGDSLVAMTSLAEKEALRGQVQMIYLDPPYGIRFGSNWQVSTRKRDVRDGKVDDATRQPEQVRAFRDTWQLGIHSYLSYLRDRLVVARDLLNESGSIFVQIGDENVHLVRSLLDEVFGSENFVSLITFKKTSGAGSFSGGTTVLAAINDYLLWYAKDAEAVKYRQLYRAKEAGGQGGGQYTWAEAPDGQRRRLGSDPPSAHERLMRADQLTSQTTRVGQTTVFPVTLDERAFVPSKGGWKTNREGMARLVLADRLMPVGNTLTYVRYLDDFPAFPYTNMWEDTVMSGFGDPKTYVVQTNTKVVERCLLMTTDPGDLVLDPTCGSGTTAYVAEQWGRRWITTDTSRVALTLARTRLMSAKLPYYLLADSPEGAKREADLSARSPSHSPTGNDVRKGFVYRRVPHVTLKSIANNPEIREGMSRAEIDAAIARHADTELLYDQPYEDPKRVRVAGRFTVESLAPHRVVSTDDERPASESSGQTDATSMSYEQTILDNLRKAGVQNGRKAERLSFDRLEAFAGTWIQAAGEYLDDDGETRRVAVSLGPQYGTVGAEHVKEAAKEALRGQGFDVLLVCGFAFDPFADTTASEFAPAGDGSDSFALAQAQRQYGRLPVLLVRMNPDLAMGDTLLKSTGAGNLFTVFGEPDVEITKDGRDLVVEIHGVDVYDPTTGAVRASSTDDIALWLVDTAYDGESFFVRHAYFTGANDPYLRLKQALRADIDEAAWASLYATRSRPFPRPDTGRIAVKVINHYGDEVLKVYDV